MCVYKNVKVMTIHLSSPLHFYTRCIVDLFCPSSLGTTQSNQRVKDYLKRDYCCCGRTDCFSGDCLNEREWTILRKLYCGDCDHYFIAFKKSTSSNHCRTCIACGCFDLRLLIVDCFLMNLSNNLKSHSLLIKTSQLSIMIDN